MTFRFDRQRFNHFVSAAAVLLFCIGQPGAARAESGPSEIGPFVQSLAIAAADNDPVAAFYRDRGYKTLWTGAGDADRRSALLTALSHAADHGLPVQRYDAAALVASFQAAQTEGDRGRIEVAMTRAFLDYAHDLQSGVLIPSKADDGIVREVSPFDSAATLAAFETAQPSVFLNALVPASPDYARLMQAKITLERAIAAGGWGHPVTAPDMLPGATGPDVLALRNRLMQMGYLRNNVSASYDATITKAVQDFQIDHGLFPSGDANAATMIELNVPPQDRLKSIIVAMERLRWMDDARGKRHVWVNIPDFTAKIIDNGKVTFSTRSVVGKDVPDQRTPEFSDEMELMVINPSWSVPRSITVKEYLPLLKKNPNAAGHLKILDRNGRIVSRGAVNFGNYTAANFPYSMRQAPSDGNALGLVKFLFPNKYNIYLHDTPSKSLFDRDVRAFSHGCIRLSEPFKFAYALLAVQNDDPETTFQSVLKTGAEAPIKLETHVPVHLVYFTAYPTAKGRISYRRDIYGRDGRIFDALSAAGVVLGGNQG